MLSLYAVVSGRVQGVGFRWKVEGRAQALGVNGWVGNLPDGRVEILAQGSDDKLDQLITWLEAFGGVEQITTSYHSEDEEFENFRTIQ